MEDTKAELADRFERYAATKDGGVPADVMTELLSILYIHNMTPEELFFKWEAYCFKLDSEDLRLDQKTARHLNDSIHHALANEHRGKKQIRSQAGRVVPTPRTGAKGGDVFGM